MKILLIGANGNMGRRYAAILNHLEADWVGVDIGDKWPKDFDRAIVATPTGSHFGICSRLAKLKKPFLCEKPISKNPDSIRKLIRMGAEGYMVCNWKFVFSDRVEYRRKLNPNENNICYDYYSTGKDGTIWDCIQLVYLAIDIQIKTESPYFDVTIDDDHVTLDDIAYSYITMIRKFIWPNIFDLWTLKDALKATCKVIHMREMLKYKEAK